MSQLNFLADVSLTQETLQPGIEIEQNNKTKNTRGPNKDYKFDQIFILHYFRNVRVFLFCQFKENH